MTSVSCAIRQVTRLRRAAERARRILAEDPDLSPEERLSDGWSTSPYDPTRGGVSARRCGCRQDSPCTPTCLGRQQRHQWGGAGRCPAGDSGRSCHGEADGRCGVPNMAGSRLARAQPRGGRSTSVASTGPYLTKTVSRCQMSPSRPCRRVSRRASAESKSRHYSRIASSDTVRPCWARRSAASRKRTSKR